MTSAPDPPTPPPEITDRWLTVPNALCVFRLLGSLALFGIALRHQEIVFLATYLVLTATDWVDGKIARWFRQRSRIGPKLDSAADVTMYAAVLFGSAWMFGSNLVSEWPWIGAAVLSYLVSCAAGLWRFRRLPTYHTRGAKISWFLVLVAVVVLFATGTTWALRLAAAAVTLTNLEALAITGLLKDPSSDVPTVYHAWRRTRGKR